MTHSHRKIISRQKSYRAGQRGIIYVEMLLSLFTVLIAFLGICQLSLLLIAQLVVQHAATRAARAASVILEEAPKHHDNAPRGNLSAGTGDSTQGTPAALGNTVPGQNVAALGANVAGGGTQSSPHPTRSETTTIFGARRKAIVAAAYHPLATLGPPPLALLAPSLADELASTAFARIAAARLGYVSGATSLVLSDALRNEKEQFGPRDVVHVRISFLFPCGVPLAGALMCSTRRQRLLSSVGIAEQHNLRDALPSVEKPALRDVLLATLPNLTVLSAEASMPIYGAKYYER